MTSQMIALSGYQCLNKNFIKQRIRVSLVPLIRRLLIKILVLLTLILRVLLENKEDPPIIAQPEDK